MMFLLWAACAGELPLTESISSAAPAAPGSAPVAARTPADPAVLPSRDESPLQLSPLGAAPAPGKPASEVESDEPTSLSPSGSGKGSIALKGKPSEVDSWSFEVEKDQALQVVVEGPVYSVRIRNGGTHVVGVNKTDDQGSFRADGVVLPPGSYTLEVMGRKDTPYTVQVVRTKRPDPRIEREPNDDASQAQVLRLGTRRGGWLPSGRDQDVYRLSLPGERHVRLTVDAPSDLTGDLTLTETLTNRRLIQARVKEADQPLVYDGLLPPGEYLLTLSAGQKGSPNPYQIKAEALDPFRRVVDLEPNNHPTFARPLPRELSVKGTSGGLGGDDWYQLPAGPPGGTATLTWVAGEEARLNQRVLMSDGKVGGRAAPFDKATKTWSLPIGPGENRAFGVRYDGDYEISVVLTGTPAQPSIEAAAVSVSGPEVLSTVAAYWHDGQTLTLPFQVQSDGASGVLPLQVVTGDPRYRVSAPKTVKVPASGSVEVRVEVQVPDDAWAVDPVHISLGVGGDGAVAGHAVIEPVCGVAPLQPSVYFDLPDALVGGINVAASDLGATRLNGGPEHNGLFNGFTENSAGNRLKVPFDVQIDLAGERVEVAGFVLDSTGGYGPNARPRAFAIELSTDGKTWKPAIEGSLEPRIGEQAFTLDRPSSATHARLLIDDGEPVKLSEWKVIAVPGSQPLGKAPLQLARTDRDARLVWTQPYHGVFWRLLGDPGAGPSFKVDPGTPIEMVVAFRHHRAAHLQTLEWDQPERPAAARSRLEVFTSLESPVGPWVSHGTWKLDTTAGSTSTFALPEGTWGRYVKLVNDQSTERESTTFGQALRVLERPASASSPSVLGEYGQYSPLGPYERQFGSAQPVPDPEQGANDTRAKATPLKLEVETEGAVEINVDEDWYAIEVPSGANRLRVDLQGMPSLTLVDAKGKEVPVDLTLDRLEAEVEPGTYYLHVVEPKRSVAMLWDQSGSVATYVNRIYAAVGEFVAEVDPAVEAVNLLPFQGKEGTFLSETWLTDPTAAQAVLTGYERNASSSEAESALLTAMEEMEPRAGTKGILILTDAETHSNRRTPELWQRFSRVRPRVFSMELHIGRVRWHQHLMENWSRIDDGHYTTFNSMATLDAAFDRAACHLRRPLSYALTASVRTEVPPAPGTLEVAAADRISNAVEVIVDASGSMQKRIGGKTRIQIAREVLDDLVTEILPAGTPFALRAFGHKESKSCRTDLEIPLAPLDPKAVAAKVAKIDAKELARTPLGKSLELVASDLKGHDGPKMVVLLTDGKETCKGDPADAIAKLKEDGIDLRVNIVGFAIEDKGLEKSFAQWAQVGGGLYLSASDQEELAAAMVKAVQPKFQVLDASGEVVLEGTVGQAAVELAAGVYTVRVQTSPLQRFELEIEPAESERIQLE